MNEDTFKGKWKQFKGDAKQWWGELTDDDIDKVEGKRDKLAGALQERYGWEKARAEEEIDRRFNESREPEGKAGKKPAPAGKVK